MNYRTPVSVAAALILAGTVCAQTGMAPKTTMDERMTGVAAGTRVQTPAGELLGTVEDVIPNVRTGRPGYVLVDTTFGMTTAIPYAAIMPNVHNGRIVLDRSRLERSPAVHASEVQDPSNSAWQRQAEQYWSN
jgi:PRC-barrel domain